MNSNNNVDTRVSAIHDVPISICAPCVASRILVTRILAPSITATDVPYAAIDCWMPT